MGSILRNHPVKLTVAFIFKQPIILEKVKSILKKRFGEIDFTSAILPFDYTDYYQKEMGDGLKRVFISFTKLIPPENLSKIKVFTNKIEAKFSESRCRAINIDPGYLDLARLVLASTKDFSHRIYLSHGIYADLTLIFKDCSFRSNPWTYPDYRTENYIKIFHQIREIYACQIKNK